MLLLKLLLCLNVYAKLAEYENIYDYILDFDKLQNKIGQFSTQALTQGCVITFELIKFLR
jgi:hypothetical protein